MERKNLDNISRRIDSPPVLGSHEEIVRRASCLGCKYGICRFRISPGIQRDHEFGGAYHFLAGLRALLLGAFLLGAIVGLGPAVRIVPQCRMFVQVRGLARGSRAGVVFVGLLSWLEVIMVERALVV
jgi:hypothetical protein